MKKLLFYLFLAYAAHAQEKKVVVYGQMTSDYKDAQIDTIVGIYVSYTTNDNSYLTFPENISKDGYYTRTLKEAETVTIESNVHDFYAPAVTVGVKGKDSIRIDLKLIPKPYIYTTQKAMADTKSGNVQLVTFDSLEYTWTRKIKLRKDFGFEYVLIAEPEDNDFVDKIKDYNRFAEDFLGLKDAEWQRKLQITRDSVVNFDADDYGRKHHIDIAKLKILPLGKLPKAMQEKITMWQTHYNNWYTVQLKDYTFDYTFKVIKTDKDYNHFNLLPERLSMDYQTMVPELLKLLTNSTEVGMDNYPGIMWSRGLAPTGPIGCVAIPYSEDDLFTVAGRANHLLKRLTWQDFGDVLPNPDEQYLKKLQNRWAYWLLQLQEK